MHAVRACLAVSKVRVVAAAAAWADRFSMFSVSVFNHSLKHPDTRAIADELDGCHVSVFFSSFVDSAALILKGQKQRLPRRFSRHGSGTEADNLKACFLLPAGCKVPKCQISTMKLGFH